MAHQRYLFRNANQASPRLAFAQSYWALQEREQSIEESLERACASGFEYLEAGLRDERMAPLRSILKRMPLTLIAQGWASTVQEATVFFQRAVELGAVAMNLHLGHAYLKDEDALRMVDEAYALSERFNLPLVLETHRGRLTQDLHRTRMLMQQRPHVRIALDVSHYLVAGETLGGNATEFYAALAPLLQATKLIHGRISNGQQIQVSTAHVDAVGFTKSIWQQAMAAWLSDAPQDAVLIFEPELGPPPYAYLDEDCAETFSRSGQTNELVRLAREAWDAAQKREMA
ncbi:sugar phosphate isomerase/epimerase family protein [Terriglobus roseus]|uniref:Sugar phosphate isomerase/epimerase n=1 Tax=Terriglobus roseus TaxID=392734 RepID=A0A1G7KPH0_9BACT|nr:hypothetical protein [Terriglobus roseus]SDF38840.1 Sugar phosphate isomerase/epimerase [Terriglobus roseus]